VLTDDGNSGGWRSRQRAQQWQRRMARRVEWGESLAAATRERRRTRPRCGSYAGIRTWNTHGGSGCMGCVWSGGGGWSADSVDARWRTVTEPPWPGHVHACTLARHAAMGHRGLLAHGPYPLKPFSKLSQRLKFKTKVFPMSKNTQIFRSIA
jgi:hypothetical protein